MIPTIESRSSPATGTSRPWEAPPCVSSRRVRMLDQHPAFSSPRRAVAKLRLALLSAGPGDRHAAAPLAEHFSEATGGLPLDSSMSPGIDIAAEFRRARRERRRARRRGSERRRATRRARRAVAHFGNCASGRFAGQPCCPRRQRSPGVSPVLTCATLATADRAVPSAKSLDTAPTGGPQASHSRGTNSALMRRRHFRCPPSRLLRGTGHVARRPMSRRRPIGAEPLRAREGCSC